MKNEFKKMEKIDENDGQENLSALEIVDDNVNVTIYKTELWDTIEDEVNRNKIVGLRIL